MADPLEYIFGSRLKSRVAKTLVLNPKNEFTASEVAKRTKLAQRNVNAELKKMHIVGLVKGVMRKKRKYYSANKNFVFYPEIRKIMAKCNITPGNKMLQNIKRSGRVIYMALTGIFTENKKVDVDLLVVGDNLKKRKIIKIISDIEADIGREVRYSIMSSKEMFYRMEMFDKFVGNILKNSHVVLVDKIREEKKKLRNKRNNGR